MTLPPRLNVGYQHNVANIVTRLRWCATLGSENFYKLPLDKCQEVVIIFPRRQMKTQTQLAPSLTRAATAARIAETVRSGMPKAKNTHRMMQVAMRVYTAWRAETSKISDPFPITEDVVIDFASYLAASDKSLATIKAYIAHLSSANQERGFPPLAGGKVRLLKQHLARLIGSEQDKALPITLDVLTDMVNACGTNGADLRNRAMATLAYYGALRVSNLIALNVSDIRLQADGANSVVVVHLRKSKTDQEGKGRDITIPANGTPTCPFAAMRTWLFHTAVRGETALFPSYTDSRTRVRSERISPDGWRVAIHAMLTEAGYDPAGYSTHSFRGGRVQDLRAAGANDTDGMEITGHKNAEIYAGYDGAASAEKQKRAADAVIRYYNGLITNK